MDDHRKPLEYDRTIQPAVTRRQFRLLLVLMLIQVVMTAQSTYLPGVVGWLKAQWADHQAAVAKRAEAARVAGLEQQCRAFTRPAEMVVWEEDPALAAPLLAQGGYQPVKAYDLTSSPAGALIPPGVCATAPAALDDVLRPTLPPSDAGLVFVHGLHSARGTERLVVVWATGRIDLPDAMKNSSPPTRDPIDGQLSKVHGLVATALRLSSEPPSVNASTELWLRPFGQPIDVPVRWLPPSAPGQPTTLHVKQVETFRVYAGQLDPADPAHFTIDYALDGNRATVDAYLSDDGSLRLTPRQGMVSGGMWFPHAK